MKNSNKFYSSTEVNGSSKGQGPCSGRQKFYDSMSNHGGSQPQSKVGGKRNKFATVGRHTKTVGSK